MKKNARVIFYDWFRIFATLFVILGHCAYLNITTTFGGINYTLPDNISIVYNSSIFYTLSCWVYGFHMPLFFFLSGAVLRLKPLKNFDKFCISKFKRLIVPYFLCGILFMLPIKYLTGFYTKDSWILSLNGFWQGIDSGHLWFLPTLFWCMIIFYLIKKTFEKFNIKSEFVLLLAITIIPNFLNNISINTYGFLESFNYLFWFALGYVFEKYRKNINWDKLSILINLLLFIILSVLNFKYNFINSTFTILLGIYGTIIISQLFVFIFKNIEANKFFCFITSYLFEIYLLHDPLEYIVLKVFFKFSWLNSTLGYYAYFICRTIGVIIISIVITIVWKKIYKLILKLYSSLNSTKNKKLLKNSISEN